MMIINFVFLKKGIGPDTKPGGSDQGENTEEEQRSVKEALVAAYEKNILKRLKAEFCSSNVNDGDVSTTTTKDIASTTSE